MKKLICLASIGICLWIPRFSAGQGFLDKLADKLEKVANGMEAVNRGLDKGFAQADEQDRKVVDEEGARVVVDFSRYRGPFTLRVSSYEDANGDTLKASNYWEFDGFVKEGHKRSYLSIKDGPFMARAVAFTLETTSTPAKKFSVSIKENRERRYLVIYVSPKVLPLPEEYQVQAPQGPARYSVGDFVRNRGLKEQWQGRIVGINAEQFTVRVTQSEHNDFKVGNSYLLLADEIKPKLTLKSTLEVVKNVNNQ